MSNEIKVFENEEFGELTLVDKNGDPWFVGKEVATALGYERPSDAINQHCKKTMKHRIAYSHGVFQMLIISEQDVYRLIMRSKLDSAERFQDWVCEEVLPSIRKTGGYMVDNGDTPEELMARALKVAQDVLDRREERIRQLETKVQLDAPKVDQYDKYMDNEGLHGLMEGCRLAGLKPGLTLKVLVSKGYLFYRGRVLMPYQRYVDDGKFAIRSGVGPNGYAYAQTYFTKKGIAFLWKNKSKIEELYGY